MAEGYVFAGDVKDGQLTGMTLKDSQGRTVLTGSPEQKDGPIVIDFPDDPTPNTHSPNPGFWNVILDLVGEGIKYFIKDGKAEQVEVTVTPSNGSGTASAQKDLYVLANGIGNNEKRESANSKNNGIPDYIENLMLDLKSQGTTTGQVIRDGDMLPIPLYFPITPNSLANKVIDVFKVISEGQLPGIALVNSAISKTTLVQRYRVPRGQVKIGMRGLLKEREAKD